MPWDAWAAVGQLISAIGVIASLVFVGIQVRQSVRAAKASTFQNLVSNIIQLNLAHLANPEILDVIDQAAKGKALSAAEHQRYMGLILAATRVAQSAHYQELGLLDEAKLGSLTYNIVRHLKTETGKAVWAELAERSDSGFRDYIASLLEQSDTYETLFQPRPGGAPAAGPISDGAS